MGILLAPKPAKLFLGMISGKPDLFTECTRLFVQKFGPVDLVSNLTSWDHSEYYQNEMGIGLLRRFIFFEQLVDPELLVAVKHLAITIEADFSLPAPEARRRINLDPGYLTEAKVVLATTKDFPHRIYIGRNIYAESTLHYHKDRRSFKPVEHTYPDFRTEDSLKLFNRARELLRYRLRQ